MNTFSKITSDELKRKLDAEGNFLLIDTLGDDSYQRAHLPTAVSISAKADEFAQRVGEIVDNKNQEVIVYCASFDCQLSPQAARELTDAGFSNVTDYEGGLKDWVAAGYSLEGADAEALEEELREE